MDFRFDPLTGQAEAVSGNGQFGLTFDDWGNRFICSNRNPCMHVVIENRYLARAPNVAVPAVVHDVAAAGENSRIFPLTRAWTTSNLHAGQFTAACGVFIYRGDLLPSLGGSVFTCDPTGNLIHREIMSAKGPTFESKPAYEGREFLASRDEWFRPVSMQLGPDGALYVVDMYRAVIEHPEWVPDELKNRPDERLGDDRGRIYRIVPSQPAAGGQRSEVGGQGASRPRRRGPFPKLSQAASDQLVILLAHENAWQRETAQRLLVERQDRSVEDSLQRAAREKESPVACAHALWTLIGIGSHRPDHVTAPLRSPDARLRQCAMAALESFDIASNSTLKLLVLDHVVHDDSATLRLRAAMLPITQPGAQAVSALGATAVAHCDDPWMRRLFLLSVPNVPDAAQSLAFEFDPRTPGQRALFREVIEADVAQFGLDWAPRLMDKLLPHDASMPLSARSRVGLVALAEAVQKRRSSLAALAKSGVPDGEKRIRLASDLAAAAAEDDQLEEPARLDALQLLGFLPNSQPTLTAFALRDDLPPYRQVAIRSLARLDAIEPWTILVERLPFEAPQVRSAILDGVLQRAERIALLLDAMEAGTMKAAELDRVQMDRLLAHRDATIRQRAEKIFGSATPEDRQKALEDYQKVLAMSADPLRGKQVFARNCANCHKIGEIGVNVAPDISDSRTKTPAQLLADIIQPNRAIDANYIAWNVLLADGNSASGVLAAETSTSITLRQPEGKTLIISRSDIEQLKSSGLSLMPEGLEKNIPPQEMADLISFIKNWRYLDGRIPASR
jgi:putative heme-binding domain-containing protein